MDGRAGDGKGESSRCMKPCLDANSDLLDDSGGIASEEGFRRKAMVGGILREERIMVDDG